jgi:hypothetical protein
MPRDQQAEAADEPTTGAPAGAGGGPADGPDPAGPTTGPPAGAAAGRPSPSGSVHGGRRRFGFAPVAPADPNTAEGRRQRRRRQYFVAGISVAAAIIVIGLCAGALGIVSAVGGFRDRAADARDNRAQQNTACLELEQRLNRLAPPGAATTPAARAVAVRNENTAVRIYVTQSSSVRDQDAWRQLLDARTAYAEALDQQVKAHTPAFYVAPRADDGTAVADQLVRWSPQPCAGAIRRLATPDL